MPKSKPDILYIGLNDRDPRWHDLYELHLSTGEKTLVRKNTEKIAGWEFDNDGNLRLADRTNQAGDTEILRVDQTVSSRSTTAPSWRAAGWQASTQPTNRST